MDKQEIIENLLLCDEYLPAVHPGLTMDLILIGGAAFALRGAEKVTYDIDTVTNLGETRNFFSSFAVNDDAREVCDLPSGFEDRLESVEIGTRNIRILVPSIEDLIALKLQRYDKKDETDIMMSGFLDKIKWSVLGEIVLDLPGIRKNFDCFLREMTGLGVA